MAHPTDIEQIKAAFKTADKGGGGKITRDALKQVFKTLDHEWSDADLKDLFDLIDTQGNGFIRYDAFVNQIMQDDGTELEDEDTDEGNAANMESQADVPMVSINKDLRVKRKEYVLLAVELGEDEEEAGHSYDHIEEEAQEDGEDVRDGVPFCKFMSDLNIEENDNEAIAHMLEALDQVRLKIQSRQDEISEADYRRPAMHIALDKILRHLVQERRPLEDSWKIFTEGGVSLSKASRRLVLSFERRQRDLVEMVKEYKRCPSMLASSAGQVGNREACIATVSSFIQKCRSSGTKFTDSQWDVLSAPSEVLYVDRHKPGYDCTVGKPAGWKRLTDIIKGETRHGGGMSLLSLMPANHGPVLYKGGIRPGDIVQGQIGTCYLLGALGAVVSNNPDIIKKMIIKSDIELGIYGVRFNKNGEWTHVIIDDYMPVDAYGNLLFARSTDPKEIWVAILEKAFCKLHTCYEMCDGGRPGEAIFSCAGGASGVFTITDNYKKNPKAYFSVLRKAIERGMLLTTNFNPPKVGAVSQQGKCGEAVLPSGLVGGHVYSVLKLQEHRGTMLVKCRNPWGAGEWTGKWSDKNLEGEWTDDFVRAFDQKFLDNGEFWMSIDEFVNISPSARYARVFGPQYKKITHYGHFNSSGELKAKALWAYKAGAADEISFDQGEDIDVISFSKGWWYGHAPRDTKKGFFPGNYVRLHDRRVSRYDFVGSLAPRKTTMAFVVILMQPNSSMMRKYYKRKEDGLNYKDLSYPRCQLVVLGPGGEVVLKKEGSRRELSGEVTVKSSRSTYKIYCASVDGLGGEFILRTYVKDGTATLTEAENAHMSEVAASIGA